VVKNGTLLNFGGSNKAFVIRLRRTHHRISPVIRDVNEDLTLLIQLKNENKMSNCIDDDDVKKILGLIVICSGVVLLEVVICSIILGVWYVLFS
jgi:hypothetical protein